MGLHFKPGVDLRNMQPQTLLAWIVASEVYERHGQACFATSLYREGTWEQVMLHGKGLAIDLGLRDSTGAVFDGPTIDAIVAELRTRLGKPYGGQYDVVDERAAKGGPHIHVEFDPK